MSSTVSDSSFQTSIKSSSSVSTPSLEFNEKRNYNNFTSKPRNIQQQQQQQQKDLLEYNHTSGLIDRWDDEPDFIKDTSSSLMVEDGLRDPILSDYTMKNNVNKSALTQSDIRDTILGLRSLHHDRDTRLQR
ncbi:hypothetical protein FRX31_020503 [Thalictrum thalictroides]|uniref:Uncharacterized protein n=1 Tax=Thalictrum thalictroides TaxID=46969 RepID=A0A7J6W096_THATH|nr:hypothetical protein FRX31_020503 [Thalictrum thalictroides]